MNKRNKRKKDISNFKKLNIDKLNEKEKREIEKVIQQKENIINQKEDIIKDLNTDIIELESKRNLLESRIEKLESEKNNLKNRLSEIDKTETKINPSDLLKEVSSALTNAQEELKDKNLIIDDYEVELKTNLIYTDEGVKMYLPTLTEEFASKNLSNIKFKVGKTQEDDKIEYLEIPDFRSMKKEEAKEKIKTNRFKTGDIDYIQKGRPGIVQNQYPEPFTLAPPQTEIDLTISKESTKDKENKNKDHE
ncbi:MAG: PASTA domain containing protein [Candidatus Methanohalarchaeum thermophilum]|uniref:PASTA domain containing protein n=1 Tax=Methanohalarchaeum thermophilum TaxID=1903181 RepID=A0A1Q6DWM0_METT1|nr:MAG: PASTA domain containing protein [Candidatus Methanohalarchaeum thermophilum]